MRLFWTVCSVIFWAASVAGAATGAFLLNLDWQGWPGGLVVALSPTMAVLGCSAWYLSRDQSKKENEE